MISLRKHIDSYTDPVAETAVEAFRASLVAMAECGRRALPHVGGDLKRRLTEIEVALSRQAQPDGIRAAAREVENELSAWAGLASEHQSENQREMKEVISALARASDSVSVRDEKYSREIGGLTGKLKGIAALDDLTAMRRSIVESAGALKSCVEKMAEDSRLAVQELSDEVKEYRERLEAFERLSNTDPLTGLGNRRAFENQLQSRIAERRQFGLIMIDLNGFKTINDTYGHLAGDDLLRQFSAELSAQFAAADVVARWGGDEFAILVAGDLKRTEHCAERIRRWALGEYSIAVGDKTVSIKMTASRGVVEWDGTETGRELLTRADALAYQSKQHSR